MNNDKAERFIKGILLLEDVDFVQIKGLGDGKIFTINKQHIIDVVQEGGSFD